MKRRERGEEGRRLSNSLQHAEAAHGPEHHFSRAASQQSSLCLRPFAHMSQHAHHKVEDHGVEVVVSSQRNCDPATPPARRPARSWTEPSSSFAARGHSVATCGNGSSNSRCSRNSKKDSSERQTTRRTGRPYHLDWGCTWHFVALLLLAFALATALPQAASAEVGFLKQYSTWCGDNVCEGRIENGGWCAVDCMCGDAVCDDVEATSASCPQDCLSHVEMVSQPSKISQAAIAFKNQPAVQIFDVAKDEAYTQGIVTATLYRVIDDPTGTKKLNVPVERVRTWHIWVCIVCLCIFL